MGGEPLTRPRLCPSRAGGGGEARRGKSPQGSRCGLSEGQRQKERRPEQGLDCA